MNDANPLNGLIPSYTKAETKLMWNLSLQRIYAILFVTMPTFLLSSYIVHNMLSLPFTAFVGGVALFFTGKDGRNPTKSRLDIVRLIFTFHLRKNVYSSIHTLHFYDAYDAYHATLEQSHETAKTTQTKEKKTTRSQSVRRLRHRRG